MISLGCLDPNVSDADCSAYLHLVESLTRRPLADISAGNDKLVAKRLHESAGVMSVAEVQQALQDIGFLPNGRVDGICGYRTQSAIRLFQEYVRSVEKLALLPDGRFGQESQAHLQRWLDQGLRSDWAQIAPTGEYAGWLAWLEAVKQKYLAAPTRVLKMVNAFARSTDTHKVADWNFSPDFVHLVGIRRDELAGRFDDIFVLLINGLVFKFQGTTEPGASEHSAGPPYLVPGQHEYHFGWHTSSYLALRPLSVGVLVVRAGQDKTLTEQDLDKGLEPNATINIHWGGRGELREVNNWSEGCQTINGTLYATPANKLVNCAGFTASTPAEASTDPTKTRGAYNVLVDLVTALGGDSVNGRVKYTMVEETDLALAPVLQQQLADLRDAVVAAVR